MTEWQPIETAPRDGRFIVISLKNRHWYDGPQVVHWNGTIRDTDSFGWWLSEGYYYKDAEVRGWAPIPQADF